MAKESIKVKGSYRLQIVDDPHGIPTIIGDTGLGKNVIVNLGFNDYMAQLLGGMAGSKKITHITLGTGTAPGVTDTTLNGEIVEANKRVAITAATSATSKKLRCTATFESSNSFITQTETLRNLGFVNSVTGGTIFSGGTYATSTCAINQNVNVRNWRQLLATAVRKLLKFGEYLIIETIPSQALKREGVETLRAAPVFAG